MIMFSEIAEIVRVQKSFYVSLQVLADPSRPVELSRYTCWEKPTANTDQIYWMCQTLWFSHDYDWVCVTIVTVYIHTQTHTNAPEDSLVVIKKKKSRINKKKKSIWKLPQSTRSHQRGRQFQSMWRGVQWLRGDRRPSRILMRARDCLRI